MPKVNKLIKGLTSAGKIATAAGGAVLAVGTAADVIAPLAKPVIDAAIENHNKKKEELKSFITMPDLFPSDCRLTIDEAKEWLDEAGLKYKQLLVKPDIKFKDKFDLELIAANQKPKELLPPNTLVVLTYVTAEIVEESKKLFDDMEKQKTEAEQESNLKKAEREANRKKAFDETLNGVQRGFDNVASTTQKKLNDVAQIFKKKKKDEDVSADVPNVSDIKVNEGTFEESGT